MFLCVHRHQDGHLDFHTAPEIYTGLVSGYVHLKQQRQKVQEVSQVCKLGPYSLTKWTEPGEWERARPAEWGGVGWGDGGGAVTGWWRWRGAGGGGEGDHTTMRIRRYGEKAECKSREAIHSKPPPPPSFRRTLLHNGAIWPLAWRLVRVVEAESVLDRLQAGSMDPLRLPQTPSTGLRHPFFNHCRI